MQTALMLMDAMCFMSMCFNYPPVRDHNYDHMLFPNMLIHNGFVTHNLKQNLQTSNCSTRRVMVQLFHPQSQSQSVDDQTINQQ